MGAPGVAGQVEVVLGRGGQAGADEGHQKAHGDGQAVAAIMCLVVDMFESSCPRKTQAPCHVRNCASLLGLAFVLPAWAPRVSVGTRPVGTRPV